MSNPELNLTTTPCGKCNLCPTEPGQMVACDHCNRWYDYGCVGVTDAVKEHEKWFCYQEACAAAEAAYKKKKKKKSKKDGTSTAEESDAGSTKSTTSDALEGLSADELKAMKEEKRRFEADEAKRARINEKKLQLKAEMMRKTYEREQRYRLEEQQLEEDFRQFKLEEQERENQRLLEAKQEHLKKVHAQEKVFKNRMSAIDQELEKVQLERHNRGVKMCHPLKQSTPKGDKGGKGSSSKAGSSKASGSKDSSSKASGSKSRDSKTDSKETCGAKEADSKEGGSEELFSKEADSENESSSSEDDGSSSDDGSGESEKEGDSESEESDEDEKDKRKKKKRSGPTKRQLATRIALGDYLPKFTGNPEEWPLFIAAYKSTTKACGFSKVENLARLQKSIQEEARELVLGQLVRPKSVPRLIKKLSKHYGRPAQILERLMVRVKAVPAPKDLKGFIPFANVVEQLCDHLESMEMKEHLRNPLLIEDLVRKLPDIEKRQWVELKRKRGERRTTLRTLTDFLLQIADDAQEAGVDIEPTAFKSPGHTATKCAERGTVKGAVHLHVEEESSDSAPTKPSWLRPCRVCQRTDHRLRFCQDFRGLTLADRISFVEQHKLCRLCLGEHGGQCRYRFRCDVGGCNEAHNPLIHSVTAEISAHLSTEKDLLFRMVPLQLHCGAQTLEVLAFIDEGASVTLIEEKLADQLGIVGEEEGLTIKWTGDHTRTEPNSRKANIMASAVGSGAETLLETVRTVGKLKLPHQRLDATDLGTRYPYMYGLPIESYEGQPQMLIGLNNIYSFAPWEVKRGTAKEPIAAQCDFGWTVYGRISMDTAAEEYVPSHLQENNVEIHDASRNKQRKVKAKSELARKCEGKRLQSTVADGKSGLKEPEGRQRQKVSRLSTKELHTSKVTEKETKKVAVNQYWQRVADCLVNVGGRSSDENIQSHTVHRDGLRMVPQVNEGMNQDLSGATGYANNVRTSDGGAHRYGRCGAGGHGR